MNARDRNKYCCLKEMIENLPTVEVDSSKIAAATLSGDSNQPGVLLLTSNRTDVGTAVVGNTLVNNIGGDHVVLDFNEFMDAVNSGALARISPALDLVKNGTDVKVSVDTAYQRHATGDNDSSNGGIYTDWEPSVGDTWSLVARQAGTQDDVLDIDLGHFTMKVVEKVTVLTVK